MTKILGRPTVAPPAPPARPAAVPVGHPPIPGSSSWGSAPSTSAAERREKATGVTTAVANLSEVQTGEVAKAKATCPFIASAVASGDLPVRNNAEKPLASIDDVAKLGNTGKGSDLGELLKVFAEGNHAFMPGMSGKLDLPVPKGTLSLDFPGSQGSHPGHSGILQGDPAKTNTGRFGDAEFARLMKYAKNGHISRSDLGKFIAENVAKDPKAHAPGFRTGLLLAKDAGALAGQVATTLKNKAHGTSNPVEDRKVFQKLTKVLGDDNLIGSAGEFGLMAAFLANSPRTTQVRAGQGHEPAYSVADLTAMFKDKEFPPGWETWKKTTADWVANTTAIAIDAEKALLLNKLR